MSFARSSRTRLYQACQFQVERLERRVLLSSAIAAFHTHQDFPAGNDPRSMVVADVNRDGKPDVIVGNYSSGTVGVFLGNGNGTLQTQKTFFAGAYPNAVAVGDLNGDGKPDIVVCAGGDVVVMLGNGDGTFQAGHTFAAGYEPGAVAIADVNGDGKADLVVGDGGLSLSVLLGNGNGTFQSPQTFRVDAGGSRAVLVADLNADGKPDIVSVDFFDSSVNVLLGNGNGTFQPPQIYPVGAYPECAAIADVNGDGHLDLIVNNGGRQAAVGVLLGNGDGTFKPQVTYAAGTYSRSVAVADVNGDGHPDIVVTNDLDNNVGVFLGNGNGAFQPQVTFATGGGPYSGGPFVVAVADLNDDGRLDLVTANQSGSVSVLLGDVPPVVLSIDKQFPTGPSSIDNRAIYQVTFSEPVTGVDPSDFALALSGVTANTPVQVTGSGAVYTVTITGISGNGTFGLNLVDNGSIKNAAGNPLQPGGVAEFMPAQSFATGRSPTQVAVADLNGDGKPDLVVTNTASGQSSISVLLGNGDGTFQSQQMLDVGNLFTSVAVADVNGDGKPDLIVGVELGSGPTGAIAVLLGNGNGTFQAPQTSAAGIRPGSLVLADVNGDGRLDVVLAEDSSPGVSGSADVLLGNGNGTFQPARTVFTAPVISYVAVADLNGDGKPDLAFSVRTAYGLITEWISVLLGNGDGTFGAPQTIAAGVTPIAVADMNHDGKPDLVLNGGVMLGNGNGTFQPQLNYPIADGGYAVAVADVNGDGKLDVVESYTGSQNYVRVFLGNGNGTVAPPQTFAAGVQPLGLAVSDLNNDGRPDIVVTGGFPDVDVLLGNNTGSFTGQTYQVVSRAKPPFPSIAAFASQQTIGVGPEPRSVVTADLNGDGKPDLVVVNSGFNSIGQRLNSVGVMLGNGNGTFAPERTFATGLAPWSVAVADVNHDGIPDLIVADGDGNDVSVLLGNGNGTFGSRHTFATGVFPISVAVADVNGDGKPDLIVPNYVSRTVSVLLGNGDGTFAPQQAFATGSGSISVAVADFNHDGKLDLAVANRQWNSVSLLLGNGNGTFQPQVTYATGSTPDWIAAADVNVDGSPDIVVANQAGNSVGVLLGNGDGTFLPQQTFAAGDAPVSIAVADVNGDGSPDVIVTDYNANAAAVLLGNGDGTFQAIKTFATGMAPVAVAVADLNRDGRLDLAVTNYSGSVSVLIGDVPPHVVSINRTSPTGSITSASTVSYTVTFSEPVTGVDAGDFALALNGVTANAPIVTPVSGSVYTVTISGISGSGALGLNLADNGTIRDAAGNPLQAGGVSFQPQQTYVTFDNPVSVAAADMNLDGQLDLVVGVEGGGFDLLPGNGNGTFGPPHGFGGGAYSVVVGDMNGDGKPDVIGAFKFAPAGEQQVTVSFGNGDGTFGGGASLSTYYSAPYSVAVGDVNGDGIPDVVATVNRFPNYGVATFLGNGNGTFQPEMVGGSYSKPTTFVALIGIDGDGGPVGSSGTPTGRSPSMGMFISRPARIPFRLQQATSTAMARWTWSSPTRAATI